MQVIFEFARLRAKDRLDVISMNLGRVAKRTEMKEQFETRRIAVLLGPSRFFFNPIPKERSFHTVDLIQSDSVGDK